MDVIKIERWSGVHNKGDNHFDHIVDVQVDGIIHTLWVAASELLTRTRPELFASDEGLAYFQDRVGELDAFLLSGGPSAGGYVFMPGRKDGEPTDGKQHYHDYPRIVFTAG
jgi:hypothetical protein